MAYTTNQLANTALNLLKPVLNGLRVDNLDAYTDGKVRTDFIRDEKYIRDALNKATNAAYDVNRAQALQDALNAEDTNYANTKNAIAEMRRNLIGSGSSGANIGAANATALQALLGLGQQNTQTTTEGLRNINNVSRERAAQLSQNAVEAINQANDATKAMYDAATSAYASDRSYAAQGAAEAVAQLGSAADTAASQERQVGATNASQERQTNATNAANERMNKYTADKNLQIEQTEKKQRVTNA